MDSSGVRAILDAQQRSRLNGRLRLRRASRRIQAAFRLTGTEERLPFEGGCDESETLDRQS